MLVAVWRWRAAPTTVEVPNHRVPSARRVEARALTRFYFPLCWGPAGTGTSAFAHRLHAPKRRIFCLLADWRLRIVRFLLCTAYLYPRLLFDAASAWVQKDPPSAIACHHCGISIGLRSLIAEALGSL
jgi:hypothetical protein